MHRLPVNTTTTWHTTLTNNTRQNKSWHMAHTHTNNAPPNHAGGMNQLMMLAIHIQQPNFKMMDGCMYVYAGYLQDTINHNNLATFFPLQWCIVSLFHFLAKHDWTSNSITMNNKKLPLYWLWPHVVDNFEKKGKKEASHNCKAATKMFVCSYQLLLTIYICLYIIEYACEWFIFCVPGW